MVDGGLHPAWACYIVCKEGWQWSTLARPLQRGALKIPLWFYQ